MLLPSRLDYNRSCSNSKEQPTFLSYSQCNLRIAETWTLDTFTNHFDVFMHDWLKLALRFVDLLDDKDYLLWLIQLRSIALLSSFQRDFSKLAAASSWLYSPRNQHTNPTQLFFHLSIWISISGFRSLGFWLGIPPKTPKPKTPKPPMEIQMDKWKKSWLN